MFGLSPVFPGLGDGVWLSDLLGGVLRRVNSRGGGGGADGGEGSEAREGDAGGVQVEALGRVRVFGYHSEF